MVEVIGTNEPVEVEIRGIAETINRIRLMGKDVKDGVDVGVFQAANHVQNEVQASIIGQRLEPKSVDTGKFANSIQVDKVKDEEYKVFTNVPYAVFLEFGTSKLEPRSHFRNSKSRANPKVREIIDQAIKRAVKI